jgi:hypothetical protein|nr:MAG TPA: hypothetical protein [Caudoviricetes sp.]
MNDKEYTYNIDKYTIGVDENGEDGIGLTVAKVENGVIYFLGNCYGENARCIDLLIKENQELKKQLEERNIEYFKGAYDTHDKYYTQQKEFIKYLEDEKDRLIKETSHYYIDSFDRQHSVNETIYDEVNDILQKCKSIIGDVKNENNNV